VFTFKVNPPEKGSELAKRNFLKKIAKLFDSIGFFSTICHSRKSSVQEMWVAGLDWDNLFQEDVANEAHKGFSKLENLPEIKVPRCLRL